MAREKKERVFIVNSHMVPVGVITIMDVCRLALVECEKEVGRLAEKERLAAEEERKKKDEEQNKIEEEGREKKEHANKER